MHLRTAAMLAVALVAAVPARAQTAGITGTVLDPEGKRIAAAAVVARSSGGAVATAVSGGDGTFAVTELVPGLYDVEVTATGFAPGIKDAVRVTAGKTIEVSITLAVAPFTEAVTVSSRLPDESAARRRRDRCRRARRSR